MKLVAQQHQEKCLSYLPWGPRAQAWRKLRPPQEEEEDTASKPWLLGGCTL